MQIDQSTEQTNDQNQQDGSEQNDLTDLRGPLDNQQEQQQVPDIDYRKMYLDSVQQYNSLSTQMQQIQQQLQTRQAAPAPEPDYTDDDLARVGTVPVIKNIVAQTIRKEFGDTLGDLRGFSQQFKREQQLSSAESQFYQQYPQLVQYRDQLSSTTKQVIGQNNLDPSMYGQVALAAIGQLVAINGLAQQMPSTPSVPSRSAPASSGKPPVRQASVPRLSELERRGMRLNGMNPDDAAQVEQYLAIINNDEGITMEK